MQEKRLFSSLKQQLQEAYDNDHNRVEIGILHDAVELWRVLFEQSAEGMVVLDLSGKVVEVNQCYADMLGYSIDEMLQLYVWDWEARYSREEVAEMLAQVDDKGARFETCQRRRDGTLIDVDLSNNGANYKGQKLIFCVCRDITKRKREQAEIERLATIDNLTGLYNRYAFSDKLKSEINSANRYGNSISILMYDLDHFKYINDRYGHETGDKVLIEVSALVSQHIRAADIVGRWGGEEFMVLMPETTVEQAKIVAEKLRAVIADNSFEVAGTVTVSFGLTQFQTGETPEALYKRVDKALYLAKENGRNRVETIT
jgi:diguanylate cyclase (GGDEF)-like protein/PAS domain S-box-containing protein